MALVSLALAKAHLRITDDVQDADIQSKVDQASALVVRLLKGQADDSWTEATVPLPIQLAILKVVAWEFEHRADLVMPRSTLGVEQGLWVELDPLLIPYRDPTLR